MSFILPGITRGQTDTLICDNGGFEEDFKYYYGESSSFFNGFGSNTCTPQVIVTLPTIPPTYVIENSIFTATSLPLNNRIEIVSPGFDPVINVSKTLFGSKSLRLNSYCPNPTSAICRHEAEIDRIKKRFLVDENNRNFTIWYSAVLENPENHNNQQPYFSFKCDLASNDNFCYDGISFPGKNTQRSLLTECSKDGLSCFNENDVVKYTDWACHRFHIPKDMIGQIATLVITAADCAEGGHFGYVYIDGICEECDGGSYGSGTMNEKSDIILSCDGDSITIKGRYTLPTIDGYTILDAITVPGFSFYGLSIDTTSKTFSFRIVKADFHSPNPDCRDVIAYLDFKNSSGDHLPLVPTNAIEICLDDFVVPDVDITISGCHRNNPNDNNYSDDYYYVDFTIQDADNLHWTLERQLDDPPTGESGRYFLKQNGYGNGLNILGPFLIQEGPWTLILNYNHCADTFYITPPDYCSACPALAKAKITNITCFTGNTWTYDLKVDGAPPLGSFYRINGENTDRLFGILYPNISGGAITQNCIQLTINYWVDPVTFGCTATFIVCPPKPCTDNLNCNFEAYIEKLNCLNNGNYSVNFITKGGGFPCFRALGNNTDVTGPFNNPLGPFNEDVTITLFACNVPFNCACRTGTNCYKIYFVDRPDDCPRDLEGRLIHSNAEIQDNDLIVVPNPVIADEFLLRSKMKTTEFEIFNSAGIIIRSNKFEGDEHRIKFDSAQGVYYLKYKNSSGLIKSVKFVKL